MADKDHYFIPEPSHWPVVGSVGLFGMVLGAVNTIHGSSIGLPILAIGSAIIIFMMYGWFSKVVEESPSYNGQVDTSFRMGMMWFILSEVMFFAAFFGALFYTRVLVMPWLAGAGNNALTHEVLWPTFEAVWPILSNPDNAKFVAPQEAMGPWGLPAINTLLLLTSSITLTIAHHALRAGERTKLNVWMIITLILGVAFLALQVLEYMHAYGEMGLTLASGIYGSTFFMLTGFHGFHVTVGGIMIAVMLVRCLKGHFTAENHFAFEAAAWYWHFVDVVWLGLFIFVYIL